VKWFALFAGLLVVAVVLFELARRARFERDQETHYPPPTGPTPGFRAPAGWYPRPDGVAGQQYWDGEVWTEQHAD
jgi:hypothetical protein